MKISTFVIFFLLIFNAIITAQGFLSGEYEACYDSLKAGSDGRNCINIILNEDSTYNLQLRDDKTFRTSVGTWRKQEEKILLTPEHNSDYYDLHNDFVDKLMPERFLRIKEQSLIWEEKTSSGIKERELKKLQKCNC